MPLLASLVRNLLVGKSQKEIDAGAVKFGKAFHDP